MLAHLTKTLSTNAAVAGLALLVLGTGGGAATLAASGSPSPKAHTPATAEEKQADAGEKAAENAAEKPADKGEEGEEAQDREEGDGARRTDTHGYCVSQVAKTASEEPTGTGPDKVNHGSLVSAAAHACGKDGKLDKARSAAERSAKHGHGHGRGHGTGRPSTVTPGASTPR